MKKEGKKKVTFQHLIVMTSYDPKRSLVIIHLSIIIRISRFLPLYAFVYCRGNLVLNDTMLQYGVIMTSLAIRNNF